MRGRTLGRAWVALIAVLYTLFVDWYGGSATPLSAAEAGAYLARLRAMPGQQASLAAHPEILTNLADWAAHDDGREFYMVNLVGLNPSPAGQAADAAYARHILPLLLKHGAHPVYVGTMRHVFMGEFGRGVDRVAMVRYRSLRDFLEMMLEPGMQAAAQEKFAGLAHTENFAAHPLISLAAIRLTLGLAAALLAAGGYWLAAGRRPAAAG